MKSKRVENWWCGFEWCILNTQKVWSSNKFKKWNPFVIDELSSETVILRKRLSALYTKCIPLYFRVQNGQSLSKYQCFIRKLVCYKGVSFFLNLFELHSFSMLKMLHSKPHHQFSTVFDFIFYFSCIYSLFWAIRPWNWKAFQMNSENVESWHGIIIWPT